MLAIAPDRDWSWLKRRFRRLDALANENRRQSPLPLLSGDILHEALKALNRTRKDGVKPGLATAITYRDWLMVAMAALLALRRHNFAGLSMERHMQWVGDDWLINIPPEESKTGKGRGAAQLRHRLSRTAPAPGGRRGNSHYPCGLGQARRAPPLEMAEGRLPEPVPFLTRIPDPLHNF
jgi:hypothetical protein